MSVSRPCVFTSTTQQSAALSAFFVLHRALCGRVGVCSNQPSSNQGRAKRTRSEHRRSSRRAERQATITPTMLVSAAVTGLLVPPVAVEPGSMVLVQHRNVHQLGTERSPAGFPTTTSLNAAVPLYGGLGAPKANRANPAAGGNTENRKPAKPAE